MIEAVNKVEDFPTAFCDKAPEVEGERRIGPLPDGREYLVDCIMFAGETNEAREALANIVANWPGGLFDNATFSVSIGLDIKVREADREYTPAWKFPGRNQACEPNPEI